MYLLSCAMCARVDLTDCPSWIRFRADVLTRQIFTVNFHPYVVLYYTG